MDSGAELRAELRRTEDWFISRGTPHFIADYSAARDVLTRALPILTLVFLFEVAGALNRRWDWWLNVLAAAGGFALLLGLWAAVNVARHQRAFSRPSRVGPVEMVIFVVAPALVPLVFGNQPRQAAAIGAANVVLLGGVYLATSYALVPLTRWAGAKVYRELGAVAGLVGRALPLLLLFVTFLFVNTEVWQVASALEAPFLAGTVGLFVILGGGFLFTRLPAELDRLAQFESVAEVSALCAGTPAAATAPRLAEDDLRTVPLNRRQKGNAALVVVVSEAVQVTLVALLIAGFFVLFGLIAIRPAVIEAWVGADVDVLVEFDVAGHAVVLTAELLRVAAFLGAFSGFYFTVYVITDATYREQFFDQVVVEMRQVLAVRTAYLAAVAGAEAGTDGSAAILNG